MTVERWTPHLGGADGATLVHPTPTAGLAIDQPATRRGACSPSVIAAFCTAITELVFGAKYSLKTIVIISEPKIC